MSKSKRIIDNQSSAELLEQFRGFESLEILYGAFPFAKKLFPKLEDVFANFSEIKKQAELLTIPDSFNHTFASVGWIAYESMNLEVMKEAISIAETIDIEEAEKYLADHYDANTLKWGIMRFNGNVEFRRRLRLIELAKEDYLSERYHACIPLLLSMLDGIVNDVSKHVGFFANSVDMTAWDCIAAHETGLQALASLVTKGRNKTNEEPITIPFRNGILHGRELSFDNKIVAAKCWAALFAARDWAMAISDGKKTPKAKEKISWSELLSKIAETKRQRNLIHAWKPRVIADLKYFPFSGEHANLPSGTPERAVCEFVTNWCKRRYGLLAESLLYFIETPKGKKAGMAKEDFGRNVPISFEITAVEDHAAAISHVTLDLMFACELTELKKEVSVLVIYQDGDNNPLVRSEPGGTWKIVQNSFSDIIFGPKL